LNALTRLVAVLVVLAVVAPLQAQDPPADIADLFPPSTLAYAEVHGPAELAPQLASVFKGSVLEDSIAFISGRKDAARTLLELNGLNNAAFMGLLTSPEMFGEFKKVRIAAGLTGFTPNGEPDGVIVILTHDSPAAGLAARAFLTMTRELRKVGEVSRVSVFQYRSPNITYDNNGIPQVQNDKPPVDGPHEPTFAYTPGLVVIGTSKAAVGQVIKRFVGEEKGGGLAGSALFKESSTNHRKSGLAYYVNFPEFAVQFDTAEKVRGVPRGVGRDSADLLRRILHGSQFELYEWFKMSVNPRAVKAIAGRVYFRDEGLAATATVTIDPTQQSPLIQFLSGPGGKVELLHHARRPANFAFAVTLPETNRVATAIGLLDSIAKANGELGRLPSDVVKELEEKHKLSIAEGPLGRIHALTIVLPTKQELPREAVAAPMLILQADDAKAAVAWEEFFPKLIAEMTPKRTVPQPSSESVAGVKVFSIASDGLAWKAPVHYARSGTTFVIGLDRKLVATATVPNAIESVISSGNPLSFREKEPVALFGVIALAQVIPDLYAAPASKGPVVPKEIEFPNLPGGQQPPEELIEAIKKAQADLKTALDALPNATVTARRVGNELRIEVYQPKVQNGSMKAVIDALAIWLDRSESLGGNGTTRPTINQRFRENR
jgi:hypothetical protein